MHKILSKKIPAGIVTAAILFTTVFSMSIFANAATSYSPRLTEPASTNKYYYSDINIFYKYGYGMPNCTAYAFGRAYEILKSEPNLSHGNAEDWYSYNKNGGYYSYGSEPKLGAIACWSYSGGGHVAVVEKIENGTITFSNSGWGYKNFYLTTASTSDSHAGQSSWTFQGYIYIGDFSDSTASTTAATTEYETGIYKVGVDDYLNMRSGAGTSYSSVAKIYDGTELTVTQIKSANGYTWGYTTYNGVSGWVALDYCTFVSAAQTTTAASTTEAEKTTAQSTTAAAETDEDLMGDVNGDGVISITDATYLQRYIVGQVEMTDSQKKRGDFNGDGSISIVDVTEIERYIVNQ